MNEVTRNMPVAPPLESHSDDGLRALIRQAKELLSARENQRRKQAAAQIRRLAKEHGLDVSVKKPAGKRGRPRSQETGDGK